MKNGISLVSLMVTIVIIVLLTTTVSISALSSINNAKKISFATEISFIQENVNNYYIKNGSVPVLEKIDFDINEIDELYRNQFKLEDILPMYKLDLGKLGKIDNIFGKGKNLNDFYVVSKNSNNVYYLAGISDGKNMYYTLTDELKKVIRYNKNLIDDGIIFTKSENKFTNKNISTSILIPKEYKNISISIIKDGNIISNIYEYSNEGEYNKYVVQGIDGCYNININYLKENQIKSIKYDVINFDNTIPTYSLSDKKVYDNGEEKYLYIELSNVSDDISGVSKLKYLKSKSSLEEVRDKGVNIVDNIIEFDENTEYITLYIEDNATNYIYKIIDLREE